jgi:hypothetical protein
MEKRSIIFSIQELINFLSPTPSSVRWWEGEYLSTPHMGYVSRFQDARRRWIDVRPTLFGGESGIRT